MNYVCVEKWIITNGGRSVRLKGTYMSLLIKNNHVRAEITSWKIYRHMLNMKIWHKADTNGRNINTPTT